MDMICISAKYSVLQNYRLCKLIGTFEIQKFLWYSFDICNISNNFKKFDYINVSLLGWYLIYWKKSWIVIICLKFILKIPIQRKDVYLWINSSSSKKTIHSTIKPNPSWDGDGKPRISSRQPGCLDDLKKPGYLSR